MALVLPAAPKGYEQKNEQDTRSRIVSEDLNNLKKNTDINLGPATVGLILISPNGTRWRLTIDNTGALIPVSL